MNLCNSQRGLYISEADVERDSKVSAQTRVTGFVTGREPAKQVQVNDEGHADLTYAKSVLEDPDTEWVDWEEVKRGLAGCMAY